MATGFQDDHFLKLAIELAMEAEAAGEVPVGALVVSPAGEIIGIGNNQVIRNSDPTAHAEIVAMRAAAAHLSNYRLTGCTLYCTLEPCSMCAGAMLHARLGRLVYAARDPKAGADGSVLAVLNHPALNHRIEVDAGRLGDECGAMLTNFFRRRRNLPVGEAASDRLTEASTHGDQEGSKESSGEESDSQEEPVNEGS
jgi:tRNA(adenine34) deaminase